MEKSKLPTRFETPAFTADDFELQLQDTGQIQPPPGKMTRP